MSTHANVSDFVAFLRRVVGTVCRGKTILDPFMLDFYLWAKLYLSKFPPLLSLRPVEEFIQTVGEMSSKEALPPETNRRFQKLQTNFVIFPYHSIWNVATTQGALIYSQPYGGE